MAGNPSTVCHLHFEGNHAPSQCGPQSGRTTASLAILRHDRRTSIGGIIVIMVGRLRMSLHGCVNEWLRLGQEIFTPRRQKMSLRRASDAYCVNGKFDSKALEHAIRRVVKNVYNQMRQRRWMTSNRRQILSAESSFLRSTPITHNWFT